MSKKRVGILRGGNKDHYENSLRVGGEIILHIHENLNEKWKVVDILVDPDGVWHVEGLPVQPVELINRVDVVWNTTHPNFSVILKSLGIPNSGIDIFSFFLKENRNILQEKMKEIGIKMPRHFVIPVYQPDFSAEGGSASGGDDSKDRFILKKAKQVHEKFSPPWVIKSSTNDFDIGIHVANTYPELINAIEDIVNHSKSILVEESISGKDISMHSVKNFRRQEVYNFPALGNFSSAEKESLNEISKKIHRHLNVSDYLNSFFVLHPKRGIFLKNINFFPDLKKDSHFHQSCELVGAKTHHIIEHILNKTF